MSSNVFGLDLETLKSNRAVASGRAQAASKPAALPAHKATGKCRSGGCLAKVKTHILSVGRFDRIA
jgi:hypothetical protein